MTLVDAPCLKFAPGTVLSLERHLLPPPELLPIEARHTGTSPSIGLHDPAWTLYSPATRLALRVYFTAPGSELALATWLNARSNVVVTSLNFTGTIQQSVGDEGGDRDWNAPVGPICAMRLDVDVRGDRAWRKAVAMSGIVHSLSVDDVTPRPVVVVIDLGQKHCKDVMIAVADAFVDERVGDEAGELSVLGYYLEGYRGSPTTIDLWSFCALGLAVCDANARVSAVNFSLDMGWWCGDRSGMPSPLGSIVQSFPIFESILEEMDASRVRRGDGHPMLFAAAGNRQGNDGNLQDRQWRLAYPAVLPQVVAVTQLQSGVLSNYMDWPAVGPLKPCFGEEMRTETPAQFIRGSSFASPALAGRWVVLETRHSAHHLPRFAKLAQLVQCAPDFVELTAESPRMYGEPWVTPSVRRLVAQAVSVRNGSGLRGLVEALNSVSSEHEFLLTGSAAFIDAYMQRNSNLDLKAALDLIGDLDFLYTGSDLKPHVYDLIRSTADAWSIKRAFFISPKLRINVHALRSWAGSLHLLQCVVPEASMFVTAGGSIRSWSVLPAKDSGRSEIRLFAPPDKVWEWNPQFRSGAAGMAHGLLVWLNLNLLQIRLEKTVGGDDENTSWKLPESLDPNSILAQLISSFLVGAVSGDEMRSSPELRRQLFGNASSVLPPVDRFSSRSERSIALLKGQTGDYWQRATTLVEWLCRQWSIFIRQDGHLSRDTPGKPKGRWLGSEQQ
ncbi:hypothetical protein [Deinococcus sp. AJ005]|uniref:hypothetical protein n=1 Tax=Deinococcus sp. AJ005 TaxID=2652443 RepID=UPI00125CBE01|nr:hypothetical protein [Deinococcus sp. AJ005]QFP75037.1 hypothetical protein DAAJ005_00285 [Deinococcus sp. AJ005]